ncbi:MAG: hypothetical protein M1833_001227 [Piccolia ochrophora]|nr:MAG: hypothetical protein M1833_001227 [Piccolia ochrophora]
MPAVILEDGIDRPLAKRTKPDDFLTILPGRSRGTSRIFAPFRTLGLVSPTPVPFTSLPLGKTTFQITTSLGRCLQTYDLRRGLNLVFLSRPQTPHDITATTSWQRRVFAAWGGAEPGTPVGVWVFQRGKKVDELEIPSALSEPILQLLIFGSWIIGCGPTSMHVWKARSYEYYTSLTPISPYVASSHNLLSGGICNMPTFLNKVFVGRADGRVEIWNVSTGKLIYSILPPTSDAGAVTTLQPTPALSLLAIGYASGSVVIHDVRTDTAIIQLDAESTRLNSITSISFRTDGLGAGKDGTRPGVMATTTLRSCDVTFWDLNDNGRVMGVLRGAHYPRSSAEGGVEGGINKVEFLSGQSVIVTGGLDNSLKTWIFDESPFSAVPRILHSRSGHAAPVSTLQFLPTDADGADSGGKWLLSAGRDRSLWAWSLRRDGQSTELSQGKIRKQAKQIGLFGAGLNSAEPSTSLEDLKATEITCIATCLNRDGGFGAAAGGGSIWTNTRSSNARKAGQDITSSSSTGWESVLTGHRGDKMARTWFWGRKKAGRWAFETGDGGSVTFWDFSTGVLKDEITCHPMIPITKLQYHRSSDLVALSCDNQIIRVVDVETRKVVRELPCLEARINDFCFSNDGRWIVAAATDSLIRVWDLPTGHLIDAIRLGSMCTALAFSGTGEYLATAHSEGVGISIWNNKSLFTHVSTRAIKPSDITMIAAPSVSGEGGQNLLDPAFVGDSGSETGVDEPAAPNLDQLSADLTTLSIVPKSRWQTMLHLDLIKQRNKPTQPPQPPEKAPFFLPSLEHTTTKPINTPHEDDNATQNAQLVAERSRVMKFNPTGSESVVSTLLQEGSRTKDYTSFSAHLSTLSPSASDLAIRSLTSSEINLFLHALTGRLREKRDYELVQAWMTVFLRAHGEEVRRDDADGEQLRDSLRAWRVEQEREAERLDALVGFCGGVLTWLRSSR